MNKEHCEAIDDVCAFPSLECSGCLHGGKHEVTDMDNIAIKAAEYICDTLCVARAVSFLSQETMDDICENCKIEGYFGKMLNEYNKVNDFEKSQSAKLLQKVAELEKKQRWIPITERLPISEKKAFGSSTKRVSVIACQRNGVVQEMEFEFETNDFWEAGDTNHIEHWEEDSQDSGCEIIAWMPLPEPYMETY